jgi:arylsulfatase A-like enzyme
MEEKRRHFRQPPWIGFRFGAYLVGVESLIVLLPVMLKLRQSGLLLALVSSAAVYVGVFAALGWVFGRASVLRERPSLLVVAMLATLGLATLATGENVAPVLLFGIPAALFAWAGTRMSGRPSKLRLALRSLVVLVFGLAFLPLLLPTPRDSMETAEPPAGSAPNLVLVVLDTVRRDHLSTYGYPLETSPELTRLAAEGIRYDQARVNGMWSLPSHATFFTGDHPSLHGAHYEHWMLDEEQDTLAEALAGFGYQTVCITGNPLISRGLGTADGFEVLEESWRTHWIQESLNLWRVLRPVWDRDHDKGGAAGVRFLERWLEEDRATDRPFFLFVNVMDPHAPYNDVPAAYQDRFLPEGISRRDARRTDAEVFFHHVFASPLALTDEEILSVRRSYDGATLYGDAVLGDIVASLDAAGLTEDTLVVVTSDHGELLGEHDLWGHVHSLYDELLRVPMVMRFPGHIAPASVSGASVQGIDLVPTLLSAAGVPREDWPSARGLDLNATWNPEAHVPRRATVAEHFTPSMLPTNADTTMSGDLDGLFVRRRGVIRAAVRGATKYTVSSGGEERLFLLSEDPAEVRDRTSDLPDPLTASRATLTEWIEAEGVAWSDSVQVQGPELDPATRQRLQELGYIE